MKEKTLLTFIETLKAIDASNLSISAYCQKNLIKEGTIYVKMNNIKKSVDHTTELYQKIVELYDKIISKNRKVKVEAPVKEVVHNNETDELEIIRDDDNKIIEYQVNAAVKDKPNFVATLSREEVEDLYGLYTYYGGSITARQVGKEFIRFTLPEIKKLFRVLGITKDSLWAPPHLLEELSLDELATYRMNLKEKAAFKYADARMERDFTSQMKKMAARINSLEDRNELLATVVATVPDTPKYTPTPVEVKNISTIILHLADMHIGAKVESGALYENEWNFDALIKRLDFVLDRVRAFGPADELIINLLGDNLDGFDQLTARKDHILPQNMDNIQQCKCYLNAMHYFIDALAQSNQYNKIRIYSVRCGNHDGDVAWVMNMALFAQLAHKYPTTFMQTELFDTFFGHYKVKDHDYVICHGKDAKFMKKGMPLNIDDKNKVMIYDWLSSNGITGNKIHIIKGDLHTENFNSSFCFDYRNVLSLFGASDYANYNFTRNQCGVSYEMFIGDNLVRGAFEIK